MLKGHVFSKQIFGNQIFALFINTFLNGKNGISNNYKNSMQVSYSGSSVTIDSGAVCIQGRFVEEDTSTSISVDTDNSYCKLVIEIDLDKENTESELNQVSYKIVKGTSNYPNLTQEDIVDNNSGVYQYELARFKTTTSGITDFQDMRTFLDFDSIYAEIEQHIQDIDDGSLYFEKSNIYSCAYEVGYTDDVSDNIAQYYIDYPEGFNYYNCIILSLAGGVSKDGKVIWVQTSNTDICNPYVVNADNLNAILDVDRIVVYLRTIANVPIVQSFQIVLLKIY